MRKIPLIRKIFGKIPNRLKYYPTFGSTLKEIKKTQLYSKREIEKYQYNKLYALLKHSEETVPWYNKSFKKHGISYKDFKCVEDIQKFPFITKEEIRDNIELFVSNKFDVKKLNYVTTGGSTGIPFGFYISNKQQIFEYAFFNHSWGFQDIHPMKNTSVVLRGAYIGSKEELFYYEPITHEWHFSIYNLNESNFQKYYNKLCSIKPKFIQAYPSAILQFSNYMLEKGLSFEIDTVMLGSENLFSWQEEIIKKAFKTNIHSWYGQAEKVCLATQTKKSKLFHCYPQYGFTELINSNKDPVKIEGKKGEIVGTSFINFAMPLIRYKTLDIATLSLQEDSEMPHCLKFSKIDGRAQEFIISKNNTLIPITAINMHDDIFDDIKQFQFYQDTPGFILLKLVPKKTITNRIIKKIKIGLAAKFKDEFELRIETFEEIKLSSRGKFKMLDQKSTIFH